MSKSHTVLCRRSCGMFTTARKRLSPGLNVSVTPPTPVGQRNSGVACVTVGTHCAPAACVDVFA